MKVRTIIFKAESASIFFYRSDTKRQYTFVSTSSYFRLYRVLSTLYNAKKCTAWRLDGIPTHFIFDDSR